MAKRFVTLVLMAGLSCSLIGMGFAKQKKQPPSDPASADFDYFLLALSWAPDFCASNPKERASAECDPKQHKGLVVHGLWPQYDNGKWPQECASTPPVPSSTVKHMMPIMPGQQLIQHEWSKHGACSGLSVKDYFGAIEKLYNGLQVPDDFQHPSSSSKTSAAEIEKKFAAANNAPNGAFRISCPQNEFSAVEICLSKDLQYQACPSTLNDCRASQISVRPVP